MTRETIEYQGKEYYFSVGFDQYQPKPWEEFDGHGIVSDWTSRDKEAGEMVLASDRGKKLFYHFQDTTKRAKREGWGIVNPDENLTPKQIVRASVTRDYEHLRKFCDGQWYFALLTVEDPRTGETEHLGGIEYDPCCSKSNAHIVDTALELAAELRAREVWAA